MLDKFCKNLARKCVAEHDSTWFKTQPNTLHFCPVVFRLLHVDLIFLKPHHKNESKKLIISHTYRYFGRFGRIIILGVVIISHNGIGFGVNGI